MSRIEGTAAEWCETYGNFQTVLGLLGDTMLSVDNPHRLEVRWDYDDDAAVWYATIDRLTDQLGKESSLDINSYTANARWDFGAFEIVARVRALEVGYAKSVTVESEEWHLDERRTNALCYQEGDA